MPTDTNTTTTDLAKATDVELAKELARRFRAEHDDYPYRTRFRRFPGTRFGKWVNALVSTPPP